MCWVCIPLPLNLIGVDTGYKQNAFVELPMTSNQNPRDEPPFIIQCTFLFSLWLTRFLFIIAPFGVVFMQRVLILNDDMGHNEIYHYDNLGGAFLILMPTCAVVGVTLKHLQLSMVW